MLSQIISNQIVVWLELSDRYQSFLFIRWLRNRITLVAQNLNVSTSTAAIHSILTHLILATIYKSLFFSHQLVFLLLQDIHMSLLALHWHHLSIWKICSSIPATTVSHCVFSTQIILLLLSLNLIISSRVLRTCGRY